MTGLRLVESWLCSNAATLTIRNDQDDAGALLPARPWGSECVKVGPSFHLLEKSKKFLTTLVSAGRGVGTRKVPRHRLCQHMP